ncbi:PH domain-containing protein [Microbacterium sp.]|uniref:PH domain-containing protein n=1 Tax=Microbacterium sp. TaxID=51671 RepID=UPI003A88E758
MLTTTEEEATTLMEQHHTPELPVAGAPGDRRLAPAAHGYLAATGLLGTLFGGGVALAAILLWVHDPWWRPALLIALGTLVVGGVVLDLVILNPLEIAYTSYTVTADFVYIRRGRFFRRSLVISTAQILNVEIVEGPLLRAFGVVKVSFTCLTEEKSISPVRSQEAERIRALVLDSQTDARDVYPR